MTLPKVKCLQKITQNTHTVLDVNHNIWECSQNSTEFSVWAKFVLWRNLSTLIKFEFKFYKSFKAEKKIRDPNCKLRLETTYSIKVQWLDPNTFLMNLSLQFHCISRILPHDGSLLRYHENGFTCLGALVDELIDWLRCWSQFLKLQVVNDRISYKRWE